MIINSKAHGTINVEKKQIFHFKEGILGFENVKDYALIDAGQPPFMWLQSIEVTNLAFIVLEPNIFRTDYDPNITEEDLKNINFSGEKDGDLLILTIVTIPENQNDMTANLQGPVILNKIELLGKQFISPDDRWTTRHKIMDELAGKRVVKC
jgi:flagellar assembly factor FliW